MLFKATYFEVICTSSIKTSRWYYPNAPEIDYADFINMAENW